MPKPFCQRTVFCGKAVFCGRSVFCGKFVFCYRLLSLALISLDLSCSSVFLVGLAFHWTFLVGLAFHWASTHPKLFERTIYTLNYHTYHILHPSVTFVVIFNRILQHMISTCILLKWNKLERLKHPSSKSIKIKSNFFSYIYLPVSCACQPLLNWGFRVYKNVNLSRMMNTWATIQHKKASKSHTYNQNSERIW